MLIIVYMLSPELVESGVMNREKWEDKMSINESINTSRETRMKAYLLDSALSGSQVVPLLLEVPGITL